ncbi:uncharacterized protein [Epargyreus clarus]|uniref:uncharacterized protein n=1 Tax=Epargyreus clarus TaxID=520877 RepID=UPI003C2C295C
MDWLKLFALLVAVASVQIKADGPKKKIRIHLPQKVKHIHHHKKIYITNHPASSQYAPAYMPSAEGAMAVPTNVALPAVANILPLNSVELIEENQHRLPGLAPAASKLLPLYHARGYYGPTPSEVDDDYDLASSPGSIENYVPSYSSSATAPSSHPPKKVKIIKINDQPRKKVVRKGKPKRVVVRNRPQPTPQVDEELPVTTFHEQFYSDLDSSGTIRKIRKPPRVEKIVDGDTEHIHTYSEEHIHKLVFDDSPKYSSVVGVDPLSSMSALTPARPIVPFKNSQTLIAIPSHSFSNLAAVGPLSAPAHFEYAAYNPRDVTHDHIFHDHGEISADIELTKNTLGLPPKVSYNSQGLRISGGAHKRPKNKYGQRIKKINKPHPTDFSYYESIYTSSNKPKKIQRPTLPFLTEAPEANLEEYRPISNIRYKENGHVKPRNLVPTYYGKPANEYRAQQSSASAPFSVSSTVVHDYKPKSYGGGSSPVQRYKDPFVNFKDNYVNNFEYDNYASSSNIYATEDKNENSAYTSPEKKGKKKSVSTQNISFGGQDHLTYVDHLEESSLTDDDTPTALDNFDQFDQSQSQSLPTPTPFIIKESSPVHPYYSVMAVKALHNDQPSMPAASNDDYQYAEVPTPSTTPFTSSMATTTSAPPPPPPTVYNNIPSTSAPVIEPVEFIPDTKSKRYREPNKNVNIVNVDVDLRDRYVHNEVQTPNEYRIRSVHTPEQAQLQDHQHPLTGRAKLKYGDKI